MAQAVTVEGGDGSGGNGGTEGGAGLLLGGVSIETGQATFGDDLAAGDP